MSHSEDGEAEILGKDKVIAIVVCAKTEFSLRRIEENVSKTCGMPYEVCAFINQKANEKIGLVYNKCAARSKASVLVFVHDDVTFKTINWGVLLEKHLSNSSLGVVGVAGALGKSSVPSGWWATGGDLRRTNYYQGFGGTQSDHVVNNPKNEEISDVVVVDGCFLAMRKDVWMQFPFDEETYSGFHLYDLDICMQVRQKYRVSVVYDVLIEHNSLGNKNKDWINDSLRFVYKWRNALPVRLYDTDDEDQRVSRRKMKHDENKLAAIALMDTLKHCEKARYWPRFKLLPFFILTVLGDIAQLRRNTKLAIAFFFGPSTQRGIAKLLKKND